MAKNNSTKSEKIEAQLFKAADKLRKNIDAAEYKHIVLGLIFLKYISDSFEELHSKLKEGKGKFEGADPEDQDEYKAENVFWVPKNARWSYLHSRAKLPTIGKDLDDAMELIEKENPTLKGILPKVYAKPNLDKSALGGLIDLIGNIALGDEAAKSKDILGKVYEYFLGEFALAEGKKGGQFYTPKSIVKLLVEMIEPYKGRVYDPCCGSGGMFVMSEKFVQKHQGRLDDISIYGQESNQTTYRLARMNLAIRGIDGSQVEWNNEGSFLKDAHPDLKADYILANPPFNDSDWSGELLQNDGRWKYGTPPANNANFAWMQHFIYHLAPNGIAGFVLSNGSLSSNNSGEGHIRKKIIEADLVDCIVALPKQLFYNTGIPACLWFLSRKKVGNGDRKRTGEILLIDASHLGYMKDRTHRDFAESDIQHIAETYREWRKPDSEYKDVKGFCKSVSDKEIIKNKHVVIPGRYVGSSNQTIDEVIFGDKFKKLNEFLLEQSDDFNNIDQIIKERLNTTFKQYKWDGINFFSIDILHNLAEAIFTEWFVNFNFPSESGKPYRDSNGTMIEGEFGPIPKGWKVGNINDFGKIICGKTPSKLQDDNFGGDIPFIKIPDMHNQIFVIDTDDSLTKKGADLQKNKFLPKNSICVSCIATVGLVSITSKPSQTNQQINSIIPNSENNLEYLFFALKRMRDDLVALGRGGSATLNVNTTVFSEIEMIIPDKKILEKYHFVVQPIFKKILLIQAQQDKFLASLNKTHGE
jgi:type I restriction enzyme M protein